MQTVSYKQCRDQWCDLVEKDLANVNQVELDKFNRAFNRSLRRAWEAYFWPALLRGETRFFRDSWAAGTYAAGAEVYHAGTDRYWLAASAATAADVPGVAALWEEITALDAYVAENQTGQTPLGNVKEIWTANPRTNRAAKPLLWQYDERGVRITSSTVPTSAWILFRRQCPQWRGGIYAPTAGYAAGVTRYYSSANEGFEGDYWTALATIVANESPEAAPAKWQRLEIPSFLADFAVHGAKIAQLEGDGQLEKALGSAGGDLWTWLYDEQDKLSSQSTPRRARVANV